MAKSRRIITLDLGSQSVGFGIFRAYANGTIELTDHCRRQVLADPAGEAMRQPQMPMVLHEMVGELKLKPSDVNYSITGQSVFVRFVDLPQIDEQKIQRIISFEAQQNVPFPIDELVWDYQLIGERSNGQVQVMLVAIKADLLGTVNSAIEETGLKTSIVDVAPMARYNAFRYNYGDLTGCSLLVNIGAHTTNSLFIEQEAFFSRTIPIGGGSITAAIAREFGEPFAAAELRKQRCIAASLNNLDGEPEDAEVVRVSTISLSVISRLHTELMRSIGHYRAQQQGNSPERIFLGGGGATMPRMRELLAAKLGRPIEFFNPLRNVAVAPSAPVEEIMRSAHLLGELVGLALRSVRDCPMSLNLRPVVVARRQELEKRRPFFFNGGGRGRPCCDRLGILLRAGGANHSRRSGENQRHQRPNACGRGKDRQAAPTSDCIGCGKCSARRGNQRSILLAANSGRSECAFAQGRYLDHRAHSDVGRKTGRR